MPVLSTYFTMNNHTNITKIIEINDIHSDIDSKSIISRFCIDLGFTKSENHPDLLIISQDEKASIGITQIQEVNKWIYTRPFIHTSKAVFITHGDLLTTEAQNSLLKITEEPPRFAHIFLMVNSHTNLLDTIVSRSQLINLKERKDSTTGLINEFISMDMIGRINFCEKKSKEDSKSILDFLNEIILYLRDKGEILKTSKILEFKDLINRNVNKKLVLFNLCLEIDSL